jgi:AT-rich DNA-binding protein
MEHKSISQSVFNRLPLYLNYLKTLPEDSPCNISATTIANVLNMGEVQVRKDLAAVSDGGKPKIGYLVADLIEQLEVFLGYKDVDDAVIIGAGKLGKALLDYEGFNEYGLNIIAAFDNNNDLAGETTSGKPIFPMDKFEDLCSRLKVRIGIITVPAENAQEVCDLMVKNNILAIMNFAPVHLNVPQNIILRNENFAASLALLSKKLTIKMYNDDNHKEENV